MTDSQREALERALRTEQRMAQRQVLLKQLWKLSQVKQASCEANEQAAACSGPVTASKQLIDTDLPERQDASKRKIKPVTQGTAEHSAA